MALTYASALAEFNDYELIAIASLIVFVTGIEFLAALIFHRSKLLQNLLLSAFLVGNIVFVNLILNAAFTGLTRVYQLIAVLVAGFILLVFMKMIDENRHLAKAIPAIAFLMIVGVFTESAFSTALAIDLESEKDLAKSKAQNTRMVEFNKKPNVYFVSFDSMIPKVLLRKYMEVESTAYHEVLDANFRRFKNFFADRYPTDSSLNSLLALDIEYFSDATRNGTEMLFYPGMAPSPLFEIFKHNGYETTSLFASKYFGAKKGPYVDFYRTSPKSLALKHGPCAFIKLNAFGRSHIWAIAP